MQQDEGETGRKNENGFLYETNAETMNHNWLRKVLIRSMKKSVKSSK